MESTPEIQTPTNDLLNNIEFSDIFNLDDIQHLQDLFADANGVASIITHVDGAPITTLSNFSRLCRDIIRKTEKGCANCLKSDAALGLKSHSGPVMHQCLSSGLWDAGARITVGGRHIANWIIGQVRNEELDIPRMITYADEIGVDREVFLEALNEIPVMSPEQFGKLSQMLFLVANEHSERAYTNWMLKVQIAEREKTRILLEESENRFKVLFNVAPFGYQALDFNGRFIEVNQSWVDTFGYTQEEVMGKWFGDFLSPASRKDFRKRFQDFKAEGRIQSEFEMIHKNGKLVFIVFDGTIGYDLKKKFKQTHCILQDITDRKNTELALRESELKYRMLMDNSPDAIAIYVEGKLVFVNKKCLHLMAASRTEDLIGKSVIELVHPDSRDLVIQRMKEVEKEGVVLPLIEEKFVRLDGSPLDVEIKAMAIRWNDMPAVQIIGRNITERKHAEQAVRESEEKYRTVFSTEKDALILIDQETFAILEVNQAACELYGYSEEEMLRLKNFELSAEPELTIKKTKFEFDERIELRYHKKKDGSIFPVNISASRFLWNGTSVILAAIRDITDLKREGDKLRDSEKHLQEAQHLAHIGSWTWTIASDTVKWSEELYRINGRDPNSTAPSFSEMSSCYTTESWKLLKMTVAKAVQNGEPYELELEILLPDGTTRYTLAKGEVDWDERGKIIGLQGTVQDITERKRAQDKLNAIEEKLHETYLYLRSLIETSLDPLVTIDAEGKITDVNFATEKATGLSRNALIRTDFANYFTEPDKARTGYQKAFEQGYVVDYPLTIRHTSGTLTDVIYNASVYRNKQGTIIGIFAAARDITSRKQAEEALRKSETRLKEAQHIALIGNWELNMDTNEMVWSDEMYQIFEVDQAKSEALYTDFLNAIHPDDWVRVNKARENFMGTQQPFQIDYRLLMPDGTVKYVHECFETYCNTNENSQRSVGTVQDITLRMQTELLLHEKNRELVKLNSDKDRFMSILGHDLKSPFNSILGFLEILSANIREYDLDTIEGHINIVETSAKRVFHLLEDLLLWSRSQSGQLPYEPHILNLTTICQEILSDMKLIADTKNIPITDSVPGEINVYADTDMLKTIIRNLISNAIKYSNPGDQIVIKAWQKDSETTISVSDKGIGMTPKVTSHLFDISQIHSTKGTANEAGTGLGLLLCKEFVEKHGGKIWVVSEVRKGSTFYFSISSNREAKEQTTIRNRVTAKKEEIQSKKLNILIVDDDEPSEQLLSIAMTKFDREVMKVKTGTEAVEICRTNPDIDLVLMDIQLPEMDGYEATRRIRQFNRKVVIIAETAYEYTESRKKALEAGCNDYLQKPIKRKKLMDMVEKYF